MNLDALRDEDQILRVLRAAQERIRDPKNWCQRTLARTISGMDVWPTEPDAVQYCARGALEAETNFGRQHAHQLLHRAALEMGYGGPDTDKDAAVVLNDTANHLIVMLMFDRAQELRLAEIMEGVVA